MLAAVASSSISLVSDSGTSTLYEVLLARFAREQDIRL